MAGSTAEHASVTPATRTSVFVRNRGIGYGRRALQDDHQAATGFIGCNLVGSHGDDRLPPTPAAVERGRRSAASRCRLESMKRKPKHMERLARELAALTPEERAEAMAKAAEQPPQRTLRRDFRPPLLEGGTRWVGGSFRREDLYGDDGR